MSGRGNRHPRHNVLSFPFRRSKVKAVTNRRSNTISNIEFKFMNKAELFHVA